MSEHRTELPLVAAFRRSLAQQRGFVSAETAGTIFSNPPPSDTELQAAIEAALQASQQSEDAPCADCGHPWESWNHAESNPNSHDPVGPSQQAFDRTKALDYVTRMSDTFTKALRSQGFEEHIAYREAAENYLHDLRRYLEGGDDE